MKNTIGPRSLSFIASILLGATGCTHVIKAPDKPYTRYPARPKIPLNVAVNITDDLRKAKSENHFMGDTWEIPVGGALALNAPVFAQNVFVNSVSINNGNLGGQSVDAVLTPKLTYANRTSGATSFSETVTTFKTEWELKEPAGNVLWVETVTGECSGSMGWSRPEGIVQNALERLLIKSQQAVYSANAVQQYVTKLHPDYKPAKVETASFSSPEIAELCQGLLLTDKDGVIQSLHKLRELKATEALPQMHVCFDHPNRDVIHEVFHVMADIGNKDTIPLIEPALKSDRKEVREEAQDAIKRLRKR